MTGNGLRWNTDSLVCLGARVAPTHCDWVHWRLRQRGVPGPSLPGVRQREGAYDHPSFGVKGASLVPASLVGAPRSCVGLHASLALQNLPGVPPHLGLQTSLARSPSLVCRLTWGCEPHWRCNLPGAPRPWCCKPHRCVASLGPRKPHWRAAPPWGTASLWGCKPPWCCWCAASLVLQASLGLQASQVLHAALMLQASLALKAKTVLQA